MGRVRRHDRMGFGPGMRACFNLKRKPRDNLTEAEKFMMKTYNRPGRKGGSLSLAKAICETPATDTTPDGARPEPFLRSGTRQGVCSPHARSAPGWRVSKDTEARRWNARHLHGTEINRAIFI